MGNRTNIHNMAQTISYTTTGNEWKHFFRTYTLISISIQQHVYIHKHTYLHTYIPAEDNSVHTTFGDEGVGNNYTSACGLVHLILILFPSTYIHTYIHTRSQKNLQSLFSVLRRSSHRRTAAASSWKCMYPFPYTGPAGDITYCTLTYRSWAEKHR